MRDKKISIAMVEVGDDMLIESGIEGKEFAMMTTEEREFLKRILLSWQRLGLLEERGICDGRRMFHHRKPQLPTDKPLRQELQSESKTPYVDRVCFETLLANQQKMISLLEALKAFDY